MKNNTTYVIGIIAVLVIAASAFALLTTRSPALQNPERENRDSGPAPSEPVGVLAGPESVAYASAENILYVSNVNGQPMEKDGNGYIARVDLNGHIVEEQFIGGLHAPKGIVVVGDRLYVADIDALIEISIPQQKITRTYPAEGAVFLNDVVAAYDGSIYVSDTMGNALYRLKEGVMEKWLTDDNLEFPNGLLVKDDALVVSAWGVITDPATFGTDVPGQVKRISLNDKTITSIGDGSPIGNLDGIQFAPEGGYFVTDWMAGKLYHVSDGGSVTLRHTFDANTTADFAYIPEKELVIVPIMHENKLEFLNATNLK